MFNYKREAIFSFDTIRLLDDFTETELKILLRQRLNNEEIKNTVLKLLLEKSKYYYNIGKTKLAKKLSSVRRQVKDGKKINTKIFNEIKLDAEISLQLEKYLDSVNEFNEHMKNYISSINETKTRYSYFLNDLLFKKYIQEVQPLNYRYILDEKKYSNVNHRKTRYNYIQRNILKTSSISLSGLTTFYDDLLTTNKIKKVEKPNVYFITCFLLLLSRHNTLKHDIQFKHPLKIKRGTKDALLNERYFLLQNYNGFFVRDNLLFASEFLSLFDKYPEQEVLTYEKLLKYTDEDSIDLLVSNNVLNPDFYFYIENLNELKKLIINDEILIKLFNYPGSLTTSELLRLSNQYKNKEFITNLLIKVLNRSVRSTSYYSKYELSENNKVDLSFLSKHKTFLEENIKLDPQYNKILNMLYKNKKYKHMDLLEILFDLEGELIYKNNFWDNSKESLDIKKFDTFEKRSYQVFYNEISNGELIINSIYPGNGFLMGREFPKLSKQTILELESHLKKIFNNDFPLFELVINPNTSIINSTGLSNLPKVIWPNDLKKMKIQFIQNKLNFLLDGKPINLLYLGSIPPQQFRGAQKILLSLITPWRMVNNDGISNNIINHREIFNLKYKNIRSLIDDNSSFNTMLNLLEYFKKKNIPIKFFVYSHRRDYLKDKPLYITLLNIDAIKIFINYIKKHKYVLVMESNPNNNTYYGNKLEENICLFTDEEI